MGSSWYSLTALLRVKTAEDEDKDADEDVDEDEDVNEDEDVDEDEYVDVDEDDVDEDADEDEDEEGLSWGVSLRCETWVNPAPDVGFDLEF